MKLNEHGTHFLFTGAGAVSGLGDIEHSQFCIPRDHSGVDELICTCMAGVSVLCERRLQDGGYR